MDVDEILSTLSLEQLCGQLLVVGFEGTELPPALEASLRAGRRGGVILFRRNLLDLSGTWRLCRSIHGAFLEGIPAFVGIDEEGGRVSRLPPPFRALPRMRELGQVDDPRRTRALGFWLGECLACLGINCDFAPVLDVDSNPDNPVIGDRSFSRDAATVARHGLAFIEGMQAAGVAACGKHFPGHGDTSLDSHLSLPTVGKSSSQLESLELVPFSQSARSELASMMTAHVVYPGLDPGGLPATFSPTILDDLLRQRLRFSGVVFSDDLEMGAITKHWSIEAAACSAVRAGCDAILVCQGAHAAESALVALVECASSDSRFRSRVQAAVRRFMRMRARFSVSPSRRADQIAQLLSADA